MRFNHNSSSSFSVPRLGIWYGIILIVFAVFAVRTFYLQVIKHDYYRTQALQGQLKEYEIPAERGVIQAYDGQNVVPIVLNEEVYTVFADPVYIKNAEKTANKLQSIIGGDASDYAEKMKLDTRYSILAKRLDKETAQKVDDLEIKGLGTRGVSQRVYPQGKLASQLLGFVDDEGVGRYGVEQYFDDTLSGEPGQLRAITDAQGVPLVSNKDNVLVEPKNGERITLTIDISMQSGVEDILQSQLKELNSPSGSIVVMDPESGAINAMASYPTYDPAKFYEVEDASLFTNNAVSEPLEVGSIMKTLTVASGLDSGVIAPTTTYYDPAEYKIGDSTVRNVEEDGGAATRSVSDILQYSLNTGATWVLMQMGGGSLNEQGRVNWHNYLTDNYRFGQATGIEQGYEAEGYIPDPKEGFGLDITYANTTFGQAVSITPLQMASAFSATINGGKYYQPHLQDDDSRQDYLVRDNVIKSEFSPVLRSMHENSVATNYTFLQRPGYSVGGKTGTAEIAKPEGGYYDDKFNGTFVGYVGGDKPEYVIMVTVKEPIVDGYAGREAAGKVFGQVIDLLINNYAISTKTR